MSDLNDKPEPDPPEIEPALDEQKPVPETETVGYGTRVLRYLTYASTLFVVTSILGKIAEFLLDVPAQVIEKYGEGFFASLSKLDPWNLAATFYGYLGADWTNENTLSYLIRGDFIPKSQFQMIWRIIPGGFYTAGTILSQDWINIFTAAVAVSIGIAIVWKSDIPWLLKVGVVPLIGCVCLWLLINTMAFASSLLGGHFPATHVAAYLSLVLPVPSFLLHAVVHERQHHFTEVIVKMLTKK